MIEAPNITESQAVADFLLCRTEQSFAALFEILYPKVLRYFILRGASDSVAEELAQDVLTAVYRHSAALRDRQLFFGWLFRIARNQLLQHVRKHHRKDADTIAIEDLDPQSARQVQMGETDGRIVSRLAGAARNGRAPNHDAPLHRRTRLPGDCHGAQHTARNCEMEDFPR